ncbi:hypothetical protein BAUCODRAFT_529379 [Baudoinia panamericana UAMH 10762]|uniref:Uncharacterized protein n=1 Tax=Baudoinia panamericana (strain UAMH 10762) TaxID=717646 RepID=M2MUA3_BAUPA|nr:uncharacterized protein BAUCODRAFT_529379 [Baudoinia panamericana UAMH 10762]EMC95148.1 hypothetical protein BAUCODRAFT_529379 [Baudoinia panamericana UAMH 10762]
MGVFGMHATLTMPKNGTVGPLRQRSPTLLRSRGSSCRILTTGCVSVGSQNPAALNRAKRSAHL